jgi:hypothetical protein
MPGVAFSPEQKVELAALLADIGIDVADVAFPISSASGRRALELVLRARREGRIAPNARRPQPGCVEAVGAGASQALPGISRRAAPAPDRAAPLRVTARCRSSGPRWRR